jgi:hypothetical protein
MLFDWLNRNHKKEVAKAQLAALRVELYVPEGVTVLKERQLITPPNYFNDCFGAHVEIIYGSNRSRDEIRREYALGLIELGWARDLGYEAVDDYQVYEKGDEGNLAVDTSEMLVNPTEQDFQVIYSAWLTYMKPSYDGCTG